MWHGCQQGSAADHRRGGGGREPAAGRVLAGAPVLPAQAAGDQMKQVAETRQAARAACCCY